MIFVALVILTVLIYFFFDVILNGTFVDWFEKNFTLTTYSSEQEMTTVIHKLHWKKVKVFLFIVFLCNIVLSASAVLLISHFHAKSKTKKNTKTIGQMLHDYVLSPKEISEAFPEEYADIAAQMSEIKSKLRSHEQILRQETARKNDLLIYLAHDLKTPLASVIGYLNLLRDEGQISEDLREKYLSISLDKAEHLEDLINEFFEIARFNLSDITLQYRNINLTRLLEQLIYEFKPMLKEKNLNCNLHIANDTMLNCDPDKIQRVFDNLLRNAVLYSYEGTDIEIAAAKQDEKILLQFINHGATIPEDRLERIFEQFYRLDASRNTISGGAGLGLAIAKRIVELHNGTITAKSEKECIEFTVVLPAL